MKRFLTLCALLLVMGCGQSKKEAVQMLCESQIKGHHDLYLEEHIKHPEMAVFFQDVKTGKVTGDDFRDQLRAHAKETGVECTLLKTLDSVNDAMGGKPEPK